MSLIRIVKQKKVDIINTHSSIDAWVGGMVGKLLGVKVLRTRHLSSKISSGLNSKILYSCLAQAVVTTCEAVANHLRNELKMNEFICKSIPTGVDPLEIQVDESEVKQFRLQLGIQPEDCLAGTLCVLRSWKGISDLLKSAKQLSDIPNIKWLVVGGGMSEERYLKERRELGLEEKVIFTGHLDNPFTALASMDIFLLLSTANEGVSQASLQAAFLGKPLITTTVGGLPEVCLHQETGFQVPISSHEDVSHFVKALSLNSNVRKEMGRKAKELVLNKFLLNATIDNMESMYFTLLPHLKTSPV